MGKVNFKRRVRTREADSYLRYIGLWTEVRMEIQPNNIVILIDDNEEGANKSIFK